MHSVKKMSFNEKLITSVMKREAIWDPKNQFHKNRKIVKKQWEEIGKDLETDRESLKQKWKNLRDYYRSELKKIQKSRSESAEDIRKPNWPYFNLLAFLKPTMGSRSFANNINTLIPISEEVQERSVDFEDQSTCTSKSNDEPKKEIEEDIVSVCSMSYAMEPYPHSPPSGERIAVKRKCSDVDEYEKKVKEIEQEKLKTALGTSKEDLEYDEDLMFFKSLIPDFKILSRKRKMYLKLKVQEMLYNEVTAQEAETSS